jgi:hypothetical protein
MTFSLHRSFLKFFFVLFCFFNMQAFAQPTEADIKKQMLSAPNAISCSIVGDGTRTWNNDYNNYEYARGVEVVYTTEWPDIKVKATGSAVYQYMGNGQYSYRKMRVSENQYLGIPNPTSTEILGLINKNLQAFYTPQYYEIVEVIDQPQLAEKPRWFWHRPTSVSMLVRTKYCIISSYTNIDTLEDIREVRLYRNDMKGPWTRFIASTGNEETGSRKLGTATYPEAVITRVKLQIEQTPMQGAKAISGSAKANPVQTSMDKAISGETPSDVGKWPRGSRVLVKEGIKWYPASVLDTKPGEWFIHYDGYDAKYDLWVGESRIKDPK